MNTATAPIHDPIDQIPNVWRGRELARTQGRTVSSGHALLDAQLPGGGWPVGCLVEILQEREGAHVWQLLLPCLVKGLASPCASAPIVLVGAPHLPFGPGLQAQGLPLSSLLNVQAGKPKARLWATEQALRCADVEAVLAWLPQCAGADLRRLQVAAQQHDKLLFAFRPVAAQRDASPARLRLVLDGVDTMQVRIVKRRGPPMTHALSLPARPPRLAALLASRQRGLVHPPTPQERSHVLDRIAATA